MVGGEGELEPGLFEAEFPIEGIEAEGFVHARVGGGEPAQLRSAPEAFSAR